MKRKPVYKITWLDACTDLGDKRPEKPFKKYLATKETVALEVLKDKDVIVLITERTGDEVDRTFIPRDWVKLIEKIK